MEDFQNEFRFEFTPRDRTLEKRIYSISDSGIRFIKAMKPEEEPLLPSKDSEGSFNELEDDSEKTEEYEHDDFETDFDYLSPAEETEETRAEDRGLPYFPFDRIYEQPFDVTGPRVDLLLPGYPIKVKFLGVERHVGPHLLNPYFYTIQVNHGNFVWVVRTRFTHLKRLHTTLKSYSSTFKNDFSSKITYSTVPKFPKTPDDSVSQKQVAKMVIILEEYVNDIFRYDAYRNHRDTMELLQISPLSFVSALGHKGKEGMVRVRSGGHLVGSSCVRCCRYMSRHCRLWSRNWMIARDNFVVYIDPRNGRVKYVLLMDSGFNVKYGFFDTGLHYGLVISNHSRRLMIDLETKRRADEWVEHLTQLAVTSGSDFTQPNRYGSFVPIRHYSKACWFVDGWEYFSCLADLIDGAKEELFIASWWLTPELYLKRSSDIQEQWRLDCVLKRIAERGVKIFVLLYKEIEFALNIGSYYAKTVLSSIHPNIKVIRHPDHLKSSPLLWAHHEKIVVIDQSYAFVGGLDPCFGRWDNWNHRLDDIGKEGNNNKREGFPISQLEANFRMKKAVAKMFLPHKTKPRTLSLSSKWKTLFQRKASLIEGKFAKRSNSKFSYLYSKFSRKHSASDKKWPGKDYANFVHKDITDLDKPMKDQIDRNTVPRLPWHDVSAMVIGAAARDVARHFIQRWNAAKFSKARRKDLYPWLLPKSYSKASDLEPKPILSEYYPVNCQICRSVSTWSAGINACEQSIHTAYIDCIKHSKHYVYIENQFFITHPPGDNDIYNGIWEAIFDRILTAHHDGQTYRVYVIIPMMPGFEGDITSEKSTVMRTIAHYTYASISKGPTSLLERLSKLMPDPTEYITFFSLRNYGKLGSSYTSEMIYIHSKMLIVDDCTVIIGSANINDRSLLGRRDSEMAVVINDYETVESLMNGEKYAAGQYAVTLRKRLFAEHLGLNTTDPVLEDPVSNAFFKDVLMRTALSNTALHERIFRCVPTNETATYQQLYQYTNQPGIIDTHPSVAIEFLKEIKGFIIIFPLYFLSEEALEPSGVTVTTVLPSSCFT